MEEAPNPTLQDELEWCISQLETGLLRLNPTPKQAEETRHILGVLRSRKAPLVKKRQLMSHVFGNYRLKMAEERKRGAKAAVKPEEVQITPGDPSGGVVYRKQSRQPSVVSTSCFVPSDNSFQFDFVLSEGGPEEITETTPGAPETDNSRSQPDGSNPSGMLDFSAGNQGNKFAFDFDIPNVPPLLPSVAAGPDPAAETNTGTEEENSAVLECDASGVAGSAHRINGDDLMQEVPALAPTQVEVEESKEATPAAATPSFKKKRKKKQLPAKTTPSQGINGSSESHGRETAEQIQALQSDEQFKKEVDWCVEQLKLGLKTRKSTPKQKDEALRAIKILCSEKTVLPKKRQLMRTMFGDYRTKMAEEKRQQLKLMQAASKAARIAAVPGPARGKKCRVFRKAAEKSQRTPSPLESIPHSSSSSSSSSADPGAAEMWSFKFLPSQEEFCFNFF